MTYPLEEFRDNFWEGVGDENRVGHLIRMAGFGVILPPSRVREPNESRAKFADTVDVRVWSKTPLDNLIVEVKGISEQYAFTGPHDYDFPDVICYSVNKTRHPDLLVLLSRKTHKAVGVRLDNLYRRQQRDNRPERMGLVYEVYATSKDSLLSWRDTVDFLRERVI